MRRFIPYQLITLCLLAAPLFAQNQEQQLPQQLSELEYLQLVLNNHPMIRQAQNLAEMGDFAVLAAKGGFDPELFSKAKNKYYKETNYYQYSNSGIMLPTRLGLSLQAGYDWNDGEFLSRESTIPDAGLWYAGISLPVLQGLMIDDRRANLQQAFVDRKSFQNEARLMLNDVLLEASKYYWEFVQFEKQRTVIDEAIQLSETNFLNYKTAYEQGDKPAVDTLEAYIQLQNLTIQLQQIDNDLINSRLLLSNFLWGNQVTPLPEQNIASAKIQALQQSKIDSLTAILSLFIEEHPAIRNYELKTRSLEIENRLKREKLKPKLNVEYNLLQNPQTGVSEIQGLDNYQWGLSFSVPLFLRESRGELKMNQLKLENNNYLLAQKRLEISNKIQQYNNSFQNISKQLNTYEQVVQQYRQLLAAELRKFEIGESSIFLVNYRQMSLVNAELKYIELQSKYRIYYRQWLHSMGARKEVWLR